MEDQLTTQARASTTPLRDAVLTLLRDLFFVHTHWQRVRNDLSDGPTLHELSVVAYHVRGVFKCWLLDGGYGEPHEMVDAVEATCKSLETLQWALHDRSRSAHEGG